MKLNMPKIGNEIIRRAFNLKPRLWNSEPEIRNVNPF